MNQKFYKTADGQSGIFFTVFGAAVALMALQYPLGRSAQMGPGFFPLVLGLALTVVGLLVTLNAMRKPGAVSGGFEWRAAGIITVAILASGLLLLTAGLLVAVPVLVIVSSFAANEGHWRSTAVATVALTLMAYLIFILGLGLRIPLIWS